MIRVLLADDSATARALLAEIFASDPRFQVVGTAADGSQAVKLTQQLRPDVVSMDLRMPRMDGFEATKEIMIVAPTPIVIVSSSRTTQDVETSMCALRAGALAILDKPSGPAKPGFEETARQFLAQIMALSQVKVVRHWRNARQSASTTAVSSVQPQRLRLIAMASSTGGPVALERIFKGLPGDFPVPILVVQHISRGYVKGLADWLNKASLLHVKVAEAGELVKKRTIYLAPDDRHLGVSALGEINLSNAAPIGGFCPSATFLFESAAQVYGASLAAVILTGMGEDGVAGLQAVRQSGGRILAQDEETSVIYGMPGAAVAAGLPHDVAPLDEIAQKMIELIT